MKSVQRMLAKNASIYMIPLSLVLFIVIVSLMYVIPKIKDSVDNYKSLQQQTIEFDLLHKKRLLLESFSKDSSTYLAIAETALPQEKQADTILLALDNLTAATLLAPDSISLNPGVISTQSAEIEGVSATGRKSEKQKGAYVIPVQFLARGTTSQFTEFVKQLLASRRIFDLEKVTLTYAKDVDDFLIADFMLLVYYLPPITEIGGIESVLPELTSAETELILSLNSLPLMSQQVTTPGVDASIPLG